MSDEREWRNAEIEVPVENEGEVLVLVSGQHKNVLYVYAMMIAEYVAGEGWIIDGREEWQDANVRYWMPLPKLPVSVLERLLREEKRGERIEG